VAKKVDSSYMPPKRSRRPGRYRKTTNKHDRRWKIHGRRHNGQGGKR